MKKMDRACFERMQAEQKELAERIEKLIIFMEKVRLDSVNHVVHIVNMTPEDQYYYDQMAEQLKAMTKYNKVLLYRIGYAVQQGIED